MTALTSQYPTLEHGSVASTLGHLPRFQGTGIPDSAEQAATRVPLELDALVELKKIKRQFVKRKKTGYVTC